jgi:tetrahydromethanopterin S-methyltransferase subunit G
MNSPEKTTPKETQGASSTGPGGESAWIMKSLNDLSAEFKAADQRNSSALSEISQRLDGVDGRLAKVETKISRLVWVVGTVGAIITILYGGYELLTQFVDISVTFAPKSD